MIAVGSEAPDFEAPDSRGERLRLSSLRGGAVILYFFPKAFTSGCTQETQRFAELAPALGERKVRIVGVSVDLADTQTRFASECHAPFPIVSDADKAITRSFGVLSIVGVAKRVTFFLDEQGIVRDVVASMLPGPHLERTRSRYLPGA
jgi:thioredoxin-dependent peroxiredoxin